MQTQSCDYSVCLSVRLSVCQTRALWQNGKKSVQIFIPGERSFSLVFWEEEWLVGATPSTWNFGSTGPRWSEIADFEPVIARSASTVPSEKSSINTNRKSTMRLSMSPRCTSYVVPNPPKGGSKTQKCPKFEQQAAITPKRYEIECQLLLITNRKSHTGFRLILTSMTLNDIERRNSPYFAIFHRIRSLCWPIMSWLKTDL